MTTTINATPSLPTPRNATSIRRPKHRKPIPDQHVTFIDDLLLRLGIGESTARHRVSDVIVLPATDLAVAAAGDVA